ncbi:hypothetical protein C1645_251806 [Glomus cerebriforme]|uniref:Uncharacterized protein n=1 Tax=Glomus cerebriforme TaxID=658196 RepID=A0A397SQ43_9GLOM|nr:hypothetical protein C1645_251806 [Glomus cerebriforme]
MAAIVRHTVIVEEHTNTVMQSVFKQDQIVRDKYARHLDDKCQESDDDFIPVHQPKRKKQLSISKENKESVGSAPSKKAKTTKDTPSSSRGVSDPSSSQGVPRPSSSQGVPSSLSSESARSSTEMTSGYDRSRTPTHQIQQSTSRNQDLIRGLRKVKLQVKSQIEPICSNIVDTTNKHLMERLQLNHNYHLEPIINDATKYIDELIENSDSRSNLRQKLQVSFVPSGKTYSFDKHYEMSWVHRFADKLLSLFEASRNPLLGKNSEGWINCHLLALLIDDCFLTCEEVQVHR